LGKSEPLITIPGPPPEKSTPAQITTTFNPSTLNLAMIYLAACIRAPSPSPESCPYTLLSALQGSRMHSSKSWAAWKNTPSSIALRLYSGPPIIAQMGAHGHPNKIAHQLVRSPTQ
jgi:adenine-specific DNA glycosylase